MFTEDEKNRLHDLLNQVLPQHADALVSARVKLAEGKDDLSQAERDGLDFVLSAVQYSGRQADVLAQMQLVGEMRAKLQGTPSPKKTAKPQRKPAVEKQGGGIT